MIRSPSDLSIEEWQQKDWPLIPSTEYTISEFLGRGSYASVAGAVRVRDKLPVAIKKIDHVFCNISDAKRILREVAILCRAKHPNIVKLEDCIYDEANFRDLYLVLEYVNSDLGKLINAGNRLFEEHIKCIWLQLLAALNYLHSAQLIHRDVKPENVLISPQCEVKLCDFGLARSFDQAEKANLLSPSPAPPDAGGLGSPASTAHLSLQRQMTQHVVTRWYRAPELILRKKNYSTAIDMWSVACVIAEMLPLLSADKGVRDKRRVLFPGKSSWGMSPASYESFSSDTDFMQNGQMLVIFDKLGTPSPEDIAKVEDRQARQLLERVRPRPAADFKTLYPDADPGALDLIQKMLFFDDEKRLGVVDAIQHPYFEECLKDAEKFGDMDRRIELRAQEPISLVFDKERYPTEKYVKQKMIEEMESFAVSQIPTPAVSPAAKPQKRKGSPCEGAEAEEPVPKQSKQSTKLARVSSSPRVRSLLP